MAKTRSKITAEMAEKLVEAIDGMKAELSDLKVEMREMKELLHARDAKIEDLEGDLTALKLEVTQLRQLTTKVAELEDKLDATEAYERRDTIILSGSVPQHHKQENTKNVAVNLVKDKFGIIMNDSDISVAHRLQTRPQSTKPPNIYVKLCRRDLKKDLIYASKNVDKETPNRVFANESLTPQRSAVLRTLVRMKKNTDVVVGATSHEGQVYAYTAAPAPAQEAAALPADEEAPRVKPRDVRHRINTRAQLQRFCDEYVRKPLEDFVESWPQV